MAFCEGLSTGDQRILTTKVSKCGKLFYVMISSWILDLSNPGMFTAITCFYNFFQEKVFQWSCAHLQAEINFAQNPEQCGV